MAEDSLDDTPIQIPDDDTESEPDAPDFDSNAHISEVGGQILTMADDALILAGLRRTRSVAVSVMRNDARQPIRLQPPRWMDPTNAARIGRPVERVRKDLEIWNEAATNYQDETLEASGRAAAAEKLARLCLTYGESARAIQSSFCVTGLRILEEALQHPELTDYEQQRLKDLEYRLRAQWDKLQAALADQLAAASEKAETARRNSQQAAREAQDSATQAGTAATQASDAGQAALASGRSANRAYLAQLQQRLETLRQSSDPALASAAENGLQQAEQIARQIAESDDLATLDAPLMQLARGADRVDRSARRRGGVVAVAAGRTPVGYGTGQPAA